MAPTSVLSDKNQEDAPLLNTISQEYDLKKDNSNDDDEFEVLHLGTDPSYKHEYIWRIVLVYVALHVFAIGGLVVCLKGQVLASTLLWSTFLLMVGMEGIYMGAHRAFAHKSFKATTTLKIILLLMQVVSGQHSAYKWVFDHRIHHRYSDTDGDPHNSKRGFFFCHIGWLMSKRHPLVKKMKTTVDMSDLEEDKHIMFQYHYFVPLYFLFGFLIPVTVPVYFFGETVTNAFLVSYGLRYALGLHGTFFVNSTAHMYGMRPYDSTIQPVESWFTSLVSFGEGWHNYHHAFPWDYRAAELHLPLQVTSTMIDLAAYFGMAYDLRVASPDMVQNRIKRRGDGTHQLEDVSKLMKAVGPVCKINPTYTIKSPDPEINRVIKIRKT